jgi:hypothetical protein
MGFNSAFKGLNGKKMPLKCLLNSGDCHWYWKRTLASIQKQGRNIEKEVTVPFSTPGKSQLRKQDVVAAAVDPDGTETLKYPSTVFLKGYGG